MAIVLLETTEIEMAEELHVMLGTISVLILRTFFLEHVFFEILLPKVTPIAIGIFYRSPDVNNFLEILSNDF